MSVIIIYIYFVICFLILFYTIGYTIHQRYRSRHETRLIQQYVNMISEQQFLLQQIGTIDVKHCTALSKKLKKVNELIAFEKALDQLKRQDNAETAYLEQIEPVIVDLTIHYQHMDQMKQAYLAYFIANYASGKWQNPDIYRMLISYMDNATIYLRENVLQATYQQSDPKWIIKVFHYLTENNLFHHPKLIQDGLLTYPYDSEELVDALWQKRDTFHQSIVLGLIGVITYKSDRYKETFNLMLQEETLDIEVKTRLIRYFRVHQTSIAVPTLISLVSDTQDPVRIVAAYVLGAYPSVEVIAALKKLLTDKNWYARRNASQSLLAMDIDKNDISDILNGSDRYASEMLRYHLQAERRPVHESIS